MFKIVGYRERTDKYGIVDTKDDVVEYYTKAEVLDMVKTKNIRIYGAEESTPVYSVEDRLKFAYKLLERLIGDEYRSYGKTIKLEKTSMGYWEFGEVTVYDHGHQQIPRAEVRIDDIYNADYMRELSRCFVRPEYLYLKVHKWGEWVSDEDRLMLSKDSRSWLNKKVIKPFNSKCPYAHIEAFGYGDVTEAVYIRISPVIPLIKADKQFYC